MKHDFEQVEQLLTKFGLVLSRRRSLRQQMQFFSETRQLFAATKETKFNIKKYGLLKKVMLSVGTVEDASAVLLIQYATSASTWIKTPYRLLDEAFNEKLEKQDAVLHSVVALLFFGLSLGMLWAWQQGIMPLASWLIVLLTAFLWLAACMCISGIDNMVNFNDSSAAIAVAYGLMQELKDIALLGYDGRVQQEKERLLQIVRKKNRTSPIVEIGHVAAGDTLIIRCRADQRMQRLIQRLQKQLGEQTVVVLEDADMPENFIRLDFVQRNNMTIPNIKTNQDAKIQWEALRILYETLHIWLKEEL